MDFLEWLVDRVWPAGMSRYTGWLLVAPALLLVASLVVGMIGIADNALRQLDTETFRMSEHYTLENFRTTFSAGVYLNIMWRSLLAALLTTVLTLILAFPYAYVMVRTPSAVLRKTLLIALFLPFFIGQVVRAYGWLIVLGREGILNSLFALVGLGPFKMIYNYPSLIFGLVQYMLPFAVLLIAPAVTAIQEELELASESLGADWKRTFLHVTLPLARPGLVSAAVVVFALTLTDYAMPVVLGGGTNDFIANAVYDAFFRISDNGLGSALAIGLVLFGSTLVGILLAVLGGRTLGKG